MAAPSLVMAPGTGEGSDPAISALLPAAMGSAAPLCGPQLGPITPSTRQVLKILLQKVPGVEHPPGMEGHHHFLFLWDPGGTWSKMSVLKSNAAGALRV